VLEVTPSVLFYNDEAEKTPLSQFSLNVWERQDHSEGRRNMLRQI
jgi:hypothetical protein